MKNIFRHLRLNGSIFVMLFLSITPNHVHAALFYAVDTHNNSLAVFIVSGTVKNNGGIPFDSAEVQAIDPSTDSIVVSTLTNSSGSYSLSVNQGIYDIKAIPPAGSGFTPTILLGQAITAATIIDFVLVPAGTCLLSGKITDRDGNPIVNQLLQLSSFINLFDTTDALGNYSFIASPGTYTLSTPSSPGIVHPHLPEMFYLWTNDLLLSGNTILNIQLPNILADVTVLDPADNPVPGTTIRTELAMTSTTFSAGSVLFHGNFDPYGVTDSAGHALVWMFPTTTNVKISPPASSGYAPISLDTVSILTDTVFIVRLIPAITLSGKMTDRDGNPIVNQLVQISSFTSLIDTTDALGNYSFSVSPGTYTFSTPASPGIVHPHLPEMFYLWANDLVLSADTTIDIQLPNVSVSVTVLDPAGTPVPGTTIRTELAMTNTAFSAGSVQFHGNFDPYGVTDSAGQAIVWMFPTTTNIKISPPMASGFAPMSLDTVSIHADTVINVHLIPAITLSGIITDRDAQPIVDQLVQLSSFTNLIDTTDALGHYSFSVSPGTYTFSTPASPGIVHPHLPEMFYLWANNLTLAESTILNIR
ncbi:MAG: carboxypeptidase-like regulatory domain-containing protein, partial [Bacteroidota bacterium]